MFNLNLGVLSEIFSHSPFVSESLDFHFDFFGFLYVSALQLLRNENHNEIDEHKRADDVEQVGAEEVEGEQILVGVVAKGLNNF